MTPLLLAALLAAEPTSPSDELRIRAVGDVMVGTTVPAGHLAPGGAPAVLAEVAALLGDADATFVNLEGPLCDSGTSAKCRKGGNCFAFRSPTTYAETFKAVGIDFASTANNHAGDFGDACRRETEKALDGVGITWSGPVGSVGTRVVKGRKVALVAFHTSTATNDVNDVEAAKALVASAKKTHDLVLVSFHGGAEGPQATHVIDGSERYLGENRGDLKTFAHGVIDAGADVVFGHGPHVLRAMELYRGHLIAYSLGNFATYGRFSLGGPLGVSVLLDVTLGADGRFVDGRLISTLQRDKGLPALDVAGRGAAMVRTLSNADFPHTGVLVDTDGRLRAR
ncbi:MAG: CapA family protein [Archangium sp.]|nr:CapA family protein [Archangium sp.]